MEQSSLKIMIASIKPGVLFPESETENIPCDFIYDIIDGKPYCRKSSPRVFSLAIIRSHLLKILFEGLAEESNLLIASTPSLFMNDRNLVTGDIMVFESCKLTIDENYVQIPPKIIIELDIKVELGDMQQEEYVFLKATKLVNFGVEKVLWFFAESERVIVVDSKSWISQEWDGDVNILPGISCNIGQYMHNVNNQ